MSFLHSLVGGLHVIPSRVFLDLISWFGLIHIIWTPVSSSSVSRLRMSNAFALAFTVSFILATCGMTKRWTITFPLFPLVLLQLSRQTIWNVEASRIIKYLSTFLVFVSMGLSLLFPPLKLPEVVGGPFAIGGVEFYLPIDASLPFKTSAAEDLTCSVSFDHSHVQVKLLYPTALKGDDSMDVKGNTMPYLSPSLALEFLQQSMIAGAPPPLKSFDFLMHNWLLTEIPVQQNAPLVSKATKGKLPLVVHSHGLMGNADVYSYQAMSLASQGMLVLMVNHLDGSAPVADHFNGTRVTYDHDMVQLWIDGKEEEYVRKYC